MATLPTVEIKVDARMIEGIQAKTALHIGRLLREHAALPGTPPVVVAWVQRTTAVIEKEFTE